MKKMNVLLLCIVILALGVLGGYFFGKNKAYAPTTQNQTANNPSPTISLPPLAPILPPVIVTGATPDQVVQSYYSWYLGCTRQHVASRSPLTLLTDCPFTTTGAVGLPFVNTLQTINKKDPVLCSTETPPSLNYEPAVIEGDKATVVVHGVYNKTATNTTIRVGLEKDNKGQWKITSINCE